VRRRSLLTKGLVLGACARNVWATPDNKPARSAASEIVLGQTGVLTGPLAPPVISLNAGARLVFDRVNQAGGLHGRHIRLVSLDDKLQPDLAIENYKKLVQDEKPLAFFTCIATGPTAAAEPVFRASGVPALGGYAVADSAREKARGAAYFIRAGWRREADVIVSHLATIGISRVAWVCFDNSGGNEVQQLVKDVVKQYPAVQLMESASLKPDGSNMKEVVDRLHASRAQVVAMTLSGLHPAKVIKGVRDAGSRPAFYGMSIVSGEIVARELGRDGRGLTIAQAVPYPWSDRDELARRFRKEAQATKVVVDYASYEGYLNASVMVDALRKAGPGADAARLHTTLRAFRGNYGGMEVDFTSGEPTGSRFVELVQLTDHGSFVR